MNDVIIISSTKISDHRGLHIWCRLCFLILSKPVRLFQFCHSFSFKSPISFSISFWANTNVLQWPRRCLWSSLLSVTGPPTITLTPSSPSTGVLAPIWTGLAQGVVPGFSRPGMSGYPLCFLPHFLQIPAGLPSPQWGVFPSPSMRYHLPSPATAPSFLFHFISISHQTEWYLFIFRIFPLAHELQEDGDCIPPIHCSPNSPNSPWHVTNIQ